MFLVHDDVVIKYDALAVKNMCSVELFLPVLELRRAGWMIGSFHYSPTLWLTFIRAEMNQGNSYLDTKTNNCLNSLFGESFGRNGIIVILYSGTLSQVKTSTNY